MTLATLIVFPAFHGCLPAGPDAAEVLGEAEALLAQGKTSQAIDILEEFEERKPGNADVIEQLAFAYSDSDDPRMAAHYFTQLAELGPDRQQAFVFAAQCMEKAGDMQGAVVTYEKYIVLRPDDAGTQLAYASLAETMGRQDRALKAAEASYEASPTGAAALMSARILAASGDHQGAGEWYRRALNHPESVREASLGCLRESVAQKDFESAEAMLATIKRDFPGAIEASDQKNVPVQIERWRAQVEADKRRLAEETARRNAPPPAPVVAEPVPAVPPPVVAVSEAAPAQHPVVEEVAPSQPARRLSKAEAAALEAAIEEAALNAVAAEAAPTPDPSPVQPAHIIEPPAASTDNLALARQARDEGRVADAILLYRKALAAEPNAAAWNELSILSLDRGDTGQAFAASLEALRLAPENPEYAVQYLRVAQAVYEPRRFMRELEQMRVRFPEALQITLALARANWQTEQNARNARLLYDEFLRKAPANHPMRADVERERDALPR